ncbi:hypothetical protein [Neorhizobium petrolearium]|uniref:Uncharacterized protein n=1 Tax=Neorhizobium petrolearium TaxID=515361 RepID=A0ABY8M4L1_9HYPH|nr:hypothetical protein [Neorhizobium petrolearium]MCC2608370.1 hypothetical protein [Neorhizobium petrolearium]WGI68649.1 hypothetical protein QEO92_00680 [Neorhizobium petrolearium]
MNALPPLTDREREKLKLDKLRGIADRLTGDQWNMEADEEGIHLFALRSTGEEVKILTMHHEALPDEQELVAGALDHLFFFLGFVGRAVQRVRELQAQLDGLIGKKRAENFGFQAKQLCENRRFWNFLESRGIEGLINSPLSAETRMKGMLGISSKAELNSDQAARGRFLKLRADFYRWQREGRR